MLSQIPVGRKSAQLISRNLHHAGSVLLLTHADPDADAYGSVCSLLTVLRHLKINTQAILVQNSSKVKWPQRPHLRIINNRSGAMPKLDLGTYDYVLTLDSCMTISHILGLEATGTPRLGIGTIDHHAHTEQAFDRSQDFTLPNLSSTCEIIYAFMNRYLLPLNALPTAKQIQVAKLLLKGMIADMVGLTIAEKAYPANIAIIRQLKKYTGTAFFRRVLRHYRSIDRPPEFIRYERYMSHSGIQAADGTMLHFYVFDVPPALTKRLKNNYNQLIMVLSHYARTSCVSSGQTYAFYMLVLNQFEPGICKVSARGPLVRYFFTPLIASRYFPSGGISGKSAFGGKLPQSQASMAPALKERLKRVGKKIASQSLGDNSAHTIENQLLELIRA